MPQHDKVRAKERILLHLLDYWRLGDDDVVEAPIAITQQGIAEATGLARSHVAMTLISLEEEGIVKKKKCHIRNLERKRYAYFLTHEGVREANIVKDKMMHMLVHDVRHQEIKKGKDLLNIMKRTTEEKEPVRTGGFVLFFVGIFIMFIIVSLSLVAMEFLIFLPFGMLPTVFGIYSYRKAPHLYRRLIGLFGYIAVTLLVLSIYILFDVASFENIVMSTYSIYLTFLTLVVFIAKAKFVPVPVRSEIASSFGALFISMSIISIFLPKIVNPYAAPCLVINGITLLWLRHEILHTKIRGELLTATAIFIFLVASTTIAITSTYAELALCILWTIVAISMLISRFLSPGSWKRWNYLLAIVIGVFLLIVAVLLIKIEKYLEATVEFVIALTMLSFSLPKIYKKDLVFAVQLYILVVTVLTFIYLAFMK
ncbi:MAG: hypothetical protein DRN20_00545 [Thermoplasmata archaeon]|nr:MAG: hypothetical protein DRN20_00545 [Thermoplasmata archaeon]